MDNRLNFWITSGVLEHLQNVNGVPITDDVAKYYFSYNLLNGPKASSIKDLDILGYPSDVGHTTHKCDGTFHTGLAPLVVDDSIFRTPATAHTPIGLYDPSFEYQNENTGLVNVYDPRQLLCFPKRNCEICWLYEDANDPNNNLPRMRPDPPRLILEIDGITDGSIDLNNAETVYYKTNGHYNVSGTFVIDSYEFNVRNGADFCSELISDHKFLEASFVNGTYILERSPTGILNNIVEIPGRESCNYYYRDNRITITTQYFHGSRNGYDVGGTGCVVSVPGYYIETQIRINSTGNKIGGYLIFNNFLRPEEISNSPRNFTHYLPECNVIKEYELTFNNGSLNGGGFVDVDTTNGNFDCAFLTVVEGDQTFGGFIYYGALLSFNNICNMIHSGIIPGNRYPVYNYAYYINGYELNGSIDNTEIVDCTTFACTTCCDIPYFHTHTIDHDNSADPDINQTPYSAGDRGWVIRHRSTTELPIAIRTGPWLPLIGEGSPTIRVKFDPQEPEYDNPEIEWIHISETGIAIQ